MPLCCVPLCHRRHFKYGNDGRKKKIHCHSFSMPKDEDEFNIWCKRIKRKDRALNRKDRICSLHFEPDCLIKYFEVNRPDGSVEKVKRNRYGLRPGSIPTRFPRKSKLYSKLPDRRRLLHHRNKELNIRSSNYTDNNCNLVTRIIGDASLKLSPCLDDAKIEPTSSDDIEFFPVDPFPIGVSTLLSSSSSNIDKFTEILEFVRRKKEILNWTFFVDKLGASFFQYNSSCLFKKRVIFPREGQKPKVLIDDKEVDVKMEIKNGRDLQRLLSMVNDEKSYPLVIK